MTIVRVGTNQKYSTGWELAFGKGKKKAAAVKGKAKAKSAGSAQRSGKKPAAKKGKKR